MLQFNTILSYLSIISLMSLDTLQYSQTIIPADPDIVTCDARFMTVKDGLTGEVSTTICGPDNSLISYNCSPGACTGHPICRGCYRLTPSANSPKMSVSKKAIDRVTCSTNYALSGSQEFSEPSLCVDKDYISYNCKGSCEGYTSCDLRRCYPQ